MKVISKSTVFSANADGYAYQRSPALAIAANGYVLAFCEGRKNSPADNGKIDILVKRSKDGGISWGKRHLVAADGENTVSSPCPIVDRQNGTVCVVFCKSFANDTEEQILSGEKLPKSIWKVFSYDNGLTWTEPEKISPQVRLENWTWYATGPCHGIQTTTGRYIVPCNHAELDNIPKNVTRSHLICSDDKGASWFIGGMCDWRTNDAAIAESSAGLYMNMKSNKFGATRAYAVSKDDGLSFGECKYSELLIDPYCQGSVKDFKKGMLFCNAASEHKRENLTLRYSSDLWRHWKETLLLEKSFAGNSDIAVINQNIILVLYEGMLGRQNDCIILKRIEME